MKKICIALICLGFVLPAGSSRAGDRIKNGGEYVAAEVTSLARRAFAACRSQAKCRQLLTDSQWQQLEIAISATRLNAVQGPLTDNDGRVVDARVVTADAGEAVIELDRVVWERLLHERRDVYRLALHEFLRIIRADDEQYRISSQIILENLRNGHDPDAITVEVTTLDLDGGDDNAGIIVKVPDHILSDFKCKERYGLHAGRDLVCTSTIGSLWIRRTPIGQDKWEGYGALSLFFGPPRYGRMPLACYSDDELKLYCSVSEGEQ